MGVNKKQKKASAAAKPSHVVPCDIKKSLKKSKRNPKKKDIDSKQKVQVPDENKKSLEKLLKNNPKKKDIGSEQKVDLPNLESAEATNIPNVVPPKPDLLSADPEGYVSEEEDEAETLERPQKLYDPADTPKTIFVGNLSNNTKKIQVQKLFASIGSIKTVRLRSATGKKLFKHSDVQKARALNAYIVFNSEEDAEKALALNGTKFKDNHIRVTKSEQKIIDPKRTLFVGNLKYSATDEKLYEIFSACGELEYVRTLLNDKGCKGVAYVCFKKAESINLAMELNQTMLDDRPIKVQRYSVNMLGKGSKNSGSSLSKKSPNNFTFVKGQRVKQREGAYDFNRKKDVKDAKEKEKNKKSKAKEFGGVRTDKKKKMKKRKGLKGMKLMAKKIAPRKTTE